LKAQSAPSLISLIVARLKDGDFYFLPSFGPYGEREGERSHGCLRPSRSWSDRHAPQRKQAM